MNINAKLQIVKLDAVLNVASFTASMAPVNFAATVQQTTVIGGTNRPMIAAALNVSKIGCILERGHDRVVEVEEMAYATRVDTVGDIIYKGEAAIGTLDSQPAWRIRRTTLIDNGDDLVIEYAEGDGNFNKVWDDRFTYNYS